MRILVTGGAGFIGSAVCRELVRNTEHTCINVDKLTYAANLASLAEIEASDRYRFYKADICDGALMRKIMDDEEVDAVLHLAAESHVDRSIDGPSAFIMTNIVGTYALLEASRERCENSPGELKDRFRFLLVSTDEVFGSLGDEGEFTEETPYDPSSPYSASKAAADHLARAWHRTYGFPALLTNCSNNYGPYHFPEKLIPLTITNALDGIEIGVYGAGTNIRDWIHVEDHARALLAVLDKGRLGESYNVGARSERTNLQVVETICDVLDDIRPKPGSGSHRDLIRFVSDRPGHDFRYAMGADKVGAEVGWQAQIDFEAGLRQTVQWYIDNEDWWRPLKSGVYTGERLGLGS